MPSELSSLIKTTNQISLSDKKCTQTILNQWKETLPLFKSKILLNCHLTTATLLLVELFVASGAEFKITCFGNLSCHQPVKKLTEDLGIYLSPDEVSSNVYRDFFDVVIDCGAYLAKILRPKKGFVELTHVNSSQYTNLDLPVISVDKSNIKQLETTYGTGDAFVRAIEMIYAQDGQNYKEKNYMIFGFGKVGKGICTCLHDAGIPKSNIITIETDEQHRQSAQLLGYASYSLHRDQKYINFFLSSFVHCAVTATGAEGSMSTYFSESSFENVEYLANMGTYDEWGQAFPDARILHNKQPLNFMLEFPTKILYLDPIFSLLACATLDMVENKLLANNSNHVVQKPTQETENKVIDIWLHNNPSHPNIEWLRL